MLAAKTGDTIQWEGPLPLLRVNMLLEANQIDANSVCIKIPQLEAIIAFTDRPYFATQGVFMVLATNPLQQITSLADIKGYRVAWLSGSDPSAFVKEHLAELNMQYLTPNATQAERSILKLLAGQVDAVHELNQFALEYQARLMGVQDQVKTLVLPEPAMPIHVGFAKNAPRTPQFLERYNQAQQALNYSQEDFRKLMQHFLDNVKPVK
jgi:ABC-type amino acid transport substrate-binding protein